MKKNYIIALLFLAIPIIQLFAQPAWVRKQATPQENNLKDITRVPGTNKLVAVGEGSTVMISEDAGESWQIILHPAGLDNYYDADIIYFINDKIGLIGSGVNKLLKTIDGGYSWTIITDSTGVDNYAFKSIEFASPENGFAINHQGEIFRTVDTGNTWSKISINTYFTPEKLMFLDSLYGYINGTEPCEFMKTIDGGLTWDSIGRPEGLPDVSGWKYNIQFVDDSVGFISLYNTQPELYRTGDRGNSWQLVFTDLYWYPHHFSFSDKLNGIAVIYGGINYRTGVMTTQDDGLTWNVNEQTDFRSYMCDIINIDVQKYICVGNWGFIYKTVDGGNQWTIMGSHQFIGGFKDIFYPDTNSTLIVFGTAHVNVIYYSLMKSYDNYQTWSIQDLNFGADLVSDFIDMDTGFILDNLFPIFYKTVDGGQNWDTVMFDDYFYINDISFCNFLNGIMIRDHDIMITSDAGEKWDVLVPDTEDVVYICSKYISENKIIVFGYKNNNTVLYSSSNGGNTWQQKTIYQGSIQTMYVQNDSTYYVCIGNNIFKTTDGGNQWTAGSIYTTSYVMINSVYFPSPLIGYAVGYGPYETAFKTTDGGLSWNPMETNTTSALTSVHFIDNDHGFIFGDLGLMLETTTGGVANARKPDKAVQQIYFTPQPNPFTDQLTLQFETANNAGKSTLVITDLSGKTIKIISIGGNIDQLLLNLPQLSKGVYLLNLYQGNRLLQSEKVVKQ